MNNPEENKKQPKPQNQPNAVFESQVAEDTQIGPIETTEPAEHPLLTSPLTTHPKNPTETNRQLRQLNEEERLPNGRKGQTGSKKTLKSRLKTFPRSKTHPITKANPFSKIFFCWISEVLQISRNTPWTQEMHYNLPKEEKMETHSKNFYNEFLTKQDLWLTIWAVYKWYFLEVIIVMFFLPIYSFSSSVFSSNIIGQIKKKVDLRDPAVLQRMILSLLAIAFITSSTVVIQKLYIFRVDRFSLRIRSAVLAVIQRKIMRFSTLNSRYFTEGNITNLFQVDCKRLTTFFQEYLIVMQSFFTVVIGVAYMVYNLGWRPTGFVVAAYTANVILYIIFYCVRAKFTRSLLFHKDNRMAYFQNVLQNLEYVKIRALENFYSTKIFERREKELRAQKRTIWLMCFGSYADWSSFAFAAWAMVSYYTYFSDSGGADLSPESFFAGYLILNLLNSPIYHCIFRVNRLVEVRVSLMRISRFLTAKEVDANNLEELDPKKGLALRILSGNFKWKADEEMLIKVDQDKVEQVIERRDTIIKSCIDRESSANRLTRKIEKNPKIELQVQENAFGQKRVQSELEANLNVKKNSLKIEEFDGEDFRLRGVNLAIKKGEVVIVFGESSSGKSSLLYAMLGEMIPEDKKTKVQKSGKIGYLSQSRWLIGDSIKENICMGKPFDSNWMSTCLESSQLIHDMRMFEQGLDTILGDTSDTVSGGQRARIALSRCFYQNPDIFILDDPTSSLDSKVTAKIMEQIRKNKAWDGKTFIISTNNIKMFDYADKIVFVGKGKVEFFGEYEEMMRVDSIREKVEELRLAKGVLDQEAKEDEEEDRGVVEEGGMELDYSEEYGVVENDREMMAKSLRLLENEEGYEHQEILESEEIHQSHAKHSKKPQNVEKIEKGEKTEETKKFFLKEDKATGGFSMDVIKRSLKGSGGYIWFVFTYFVIPFGLMYGFRKVLDTTVEWGNKYADFGIKDNSLLNQILFWMNYNGILGFIKRYVVFISLVWLGRQMHSKMVFRILHCQINEFLKRIPIGQIINRFSNDIDVVDKEMGDTLYTLNYLLPKNYLNIYSIVIGVKNRFMVVPIICFILTAFWMRAKYMRAKREMVRLFQITRSPVVGLGSACILGSPVIRCLKNQEYLQKRAEKLIDENSKNRLLDVALDAWFSVNLSVIDFFVVQIPCYGLLLYTLYYADINDDQEFNNLTIFMMLIIDFSQELSKMLNYLCLAEGKFVSIERCLKFETIAPEEGYLTFQRDATVFQNPDINLKRAYRFLDRYRRTELFPSGLIEIKGVSARYPTGAKDVIDNVSLTILPKEKVGIVGRTGAGKSTFIKLLWRGMAPYKGSIKIDGQDISKIDLKIFRDQMTVISQATNLFEGTIASNISAKPMTDDELANTEALLKSLKFPAKKLAVPNLMFHLETEASNLSEGEKQIISYVRGVYNKRRIVILDEASAYVDNETEKGFKDLAKHAFAESTVFIIAHRIQTVIDCDKILVLGDGRVLEFDTPENLLADPTSEFSKICKKA